MPALKRAQLVLQTWEGDVVTSIQYEVEGVVNEYVTLATLYWLMDLEGDARDHFLQVHKLITMQRFGQQWVNCSDIMPLLGWTPS